MYRGIPAALLILLCHPAGAQPAAPDPSEASPPAGAEPSAREAARQAFSTAVSLARAGQYAAAKALFLEAYSAEPHHLVLYNIAQAELQLGELASAASFLRRFLAEGGEAISAEQQESVQDELRRIEALQTEAPEVTGAPLALPESGPSGAAAEPSTMASVARPPVPGTAATLALPEAPQSVTAPFAPLSLPNASVPGKDTVRLWGYVLTTAGFAAVGSAVGLYIWNHGRYNRWQAERAELATSTEQGVSAESELMVNQQVRENNARLASIKSFDPIPIITASVGMVAMGAGLWTLIETRGGDQVQLSSNASELELRVRGTW